MNNFLNTAMAQGYDNSNYEDNNSYSTYQTDDKKYECRTGPLEGFFTSSVEFCKHVKFDDKDRKDHRDNKTGIQGPPGPPGPQGQRGPPATINPSNAYIVWVDNTSGNNDIFFRASHAFGPLNLSNNSGLSSVPQTSSEGNNVYVVWQDNSFGNNEVFFRASHDNGQTFSSPINLSNNSEPSATPQISSEGNNVYVVWNNRGGNNFDIFFAISHDNGQTFSSPINISDIDGFSFIPQISSEGNNVYVVWRVILPITSSDRVEIFFTSSNDNGQTFSSPINLSNNPEDIEDFFSLTPPQISSSGDNVYVTWNHRNVDNDIFEIFITCSNDNGQTFSSPIKLSNDFINARFPEIASEGNNVFIGWSEGPSGFSDIFFATSHDNGQTFSSPINLSNNSGFSIGPRISSEGTNVYVVWEDQTPGNADIFFAISHDNGQTFSSPINLSNNSGFSGGQRISSEGNNVYIVWQDQTPGNSDIFVISNDKPFDTPLNISNNPGNSINPQISVR